MSEPSSKIFQPQPRAELIQTLTHDEAFGEPLLLTLGQWTMEIVCNSESMRQELVGYYAGLLDTPPVQSRRRVMVVDGPFQVCSQSLQQQDPVPGRKIKEEWLDIPGGRIVRKLKTGMVMIFGEEENLVVGPCLDYPNQVVNFINNRFIELKLNQGALLGHAAAVRLRGKGIAMAGFSGMGKSTLALHLMSAGGDFVSNDRLLIEGAGEGGLTMTGVAKWPRINPGTALHNPDLAGVMSPEETSRFRQLPQEELWQLEHKFDALIEQCFGPNRFQLGSTMEYLILLNWRFGGGPMVATQVDLERRRELLPAIMKNSGLFFIPRQGVPKNQPEEQYLGLLNRCQVLEISGGTDFDQAVQLIKNWIG
nr:HprK-related kinase B [uncultured Desulfobulbus sp.]